MPDDPTPVPRPTRRELPRLATPGRSAVSTTKQVKDLLRVYTTAESADAPLDTPLADDELLMLAVHDWLLRSVLDLRHSFHTVVLVCKPALARFADAFFAAEAASPAGPLLKRPSSQLMLLDGRFVLPPAWAGDPRPHALYDLEASDWTDRIEYQAETYVTCDLAVLLLRLLAKLRAYRLSQQEPAHAPDAPEPDASAPPA